MHKLYDVLKHLGLTIAVAESCTSGLLGSKLTSIPGASEYFKGGVIAYSREVKTNLLNVDKSLEVVSKECAISMNRGLAKLINSDIYISVTGYIGINNAKPELSGIIFYSIQYNRKEYVYNIVLDDYNREPAKELIVNEIILSLNILLK